MQKAIDENRPLLSHPMGKDAFWVSKLFLWGLLFSWPAIFYFGSQIKPDFLEVYLYLVIALANFTNIDMLFSGYTTYQDRVSRNEIGVHHVWGN